MILSCDYLSDSTEKNPRVSIHVTTSLHAVLPTCQDSTPQPHTSFFCFFFSALSLFVRLPSLSLSVCLSFLFPLKLFLSHTQSFNGKGKEEGTADNGVYSNNSNNPRQEEECCSKSKVPFLRILQQILCPLGTSPTPSPHTLSSPPWTHTHTLTLPALFLFPLSNPLPV